MDCRDEHHSHQHSHGDGGDGHDDDHVPPPDTYESQSLHNHIYHDHIRTLNESVTDAGRSVFKPWEKRLDVTKILESDVDEELLIFVPFTGLVRLHSILIRTTADEYAPKTIKLFKNRDDLDFSAASDTKAVATLTHPEGFGVDENSSTASVATLSSLDEEGIAEYAVSRAAFSNITSLTIFVEENYGEDTTKILFIGLRGEWTKISRNPVITLYEAAANPKDHKNLVPESNMGYENA